MLSLRKAVVALTAFLILAAPLAVPSLHAQALTTIPIVSNHDFDDATATYCLLGPSKNSTANVKTTGSSATLAAASGTPFADFAKGTLITVVPGSGGSGQAQERYVVVATSSTAATINVATDWSGNGTTGFPFTYRNLTCGTGAGAGWFSVSGYTTKDIHFQIEQLAVASGSVAVTIQCKAANAWASPTPVYPDPSDTATAPCHTGLFTVAGATARCIVHLGIDTSACRIGVTLTDDAGDLTTNLEQFSATLVAR